MVVELLMICFKLVQNEVAIMSDFIVWCVELYFDYYMYFGLFVCMMIEEVCCVDLSLVIYWVILLQYIVEMFEEKYYEFENINLDFKIYYLLIWMMESVFMNLLSKLLCDQVEVDEFKVVMCVIIVCVVFIDLV